MSTLLDFLMGPQQKQEEQYPSLRKAVGLIPTEVVETPKSPLDRSPASELKARVTKAAPPSRVISSGDNEQAFEQAKLAKESLGLGDPESINQANDIIGDLKSRLMKQRQSQAGDPTSIYAVGAALTGSPVLKELASRKYASVDDEVGDQSKGLLDAIKAKAGLKEKEDTLTKDLYKHQSDSKAQLAALKAYGSGGGSGGAKEASIKDRLLMENKVNEGAFKIAKDMSDAQAKFGNIKQGLASGDLQTVMNQLSNFSRYVSGQKGVLTDKDIDLVMNDNINTSWAKLQSYFSKTPTAKLPKNFTRKMLELTELAEKKNRDKYKQEFSQRKAGWTSPTSEYQAVRPVVDDVLGNLEKEFFTEEQVTAQSDNLLGGSAAAEWLKKKRGGK
jgi:hypothetical protein